VTGPAGFQIIHPSLHLLAAERPAGFDIRLSLADVQQMHVFTLSSKIAPYGSSRGKANLPAFSVPEPAAIILLSTVLSILVDTLRRRHVA
jgi:hypothetical protein